MYKDTLSSTAYIKSGVSQGSVLGNLLFQIHVNDVSKNMLFFVDFCSRYASQD